MEDGYFPRRSSLLRRVHEERAVGLLYGQRALCIGAVKPRNYVGTSRHTRNRSEPFKRITRTAGMFEAVFFGTRAQADRVLDAVRRMHEHVVGELPEDAGPHNPAGTPYSATDPKLMLWTVAVIADSATWFYERLARRLSDAEHETLWGEYIRFGELFGLPAQHVPATHAEFRDWYERQLAGDDLHLTDEARYMGHASAFAIPMPAHRQLGKRLHNLVMLHSLPPRVQDLYGLRCTPLQQAAARALLAAHRTSRPLMPRRLACGSCAGEFRMVAATERQRIACGLPTPRLSALG
jgi:uncharacterized protein (DUF2236 family)